MQNTEDYKIGDKVKVIYSYYSEEGIKGAVIKGIVTGILHIEYSSKMTGDAVTSVTATQKPRIL